MAEKFWLIFMILIAELTALMLVVCFSYKKYPKGESLPENFIIGIVLLDILIFGCICIYTPPRENLPPNYSSKFREESSITYGQISTIDGMNITLLQGYNVKKRDYSYKYIVYTTEAKVINLILDPELKDKAIELLKSNVTVYVVYKCMIPDQYYISSTSKYKENGPYLCAYKGNYTGNTCCVIIDINKGGNQI